MTASSASFDLYGFRFRVHSDSEQALQGLASDFAYFRDDSADSDLQVEICEEDPDYDSLPDTEATVYTPRNVSYRDGNLVYLDFHGRGLGIHDPDKDHYRIISRDPHLLYEAAYLFLIAHASEYLDEQGMHRVHAVCMAVDGKALLVMLPMGGGKSTLCAALLKRPEIRLMSDDAPYIGRDGRVYAFPSRIGILPGSEKDLPAEYVRRIDRMEFGPKYLLDYSYYADRVLAEADPGYVFIGARNASNHCSATKPRWGEQMKAVMTHSVVGLGLYQGMEFVFQRSAMELFNKARIAWSRLRNCRALLKRSEVYHLSLGRDTSENVRTILGIMEKDG